MKDNLQLSCDLSKRKISAPREGEKGVSPRKAGSRSSQLKRCSHVRAEQPADDASDNVHMRTREATKSGGAGRSERRSGANLIQGAAQGWGSPEPWQVWVMLPVGLIVALPHIAKGAASMRGKDTTIVTPGPVG